MKTSFSLVLALLAGSLSLACNGSRDKSEAAPGAGTSRKPTDSSSSGPNAGGKSGVAETMGSRVTARGATSGGARATPDSAGTGGADTEPPNEPEPAACGELAQKACGELERCAPHWLARDYGSESLCVERVAAACAHHTSAGRAVDAVAC